jgi:hypothetical protein
VGWIIFGANPLSLLPDLLSAPIVLVGQLILTSHPRPGTARAERAVVDVVALIGGWNVLIVALGVFSNPWWWALFALTVSSASPLSGVLSRSCGERRAAGAICARRTDSAMSRHLQNRVLRARMPM